MLYIILFWYLLSWYNISTNNKTIKYIQLYFFISKFRDEYVIATTVCTIKFIYIKTKEIIQKMNYVEQIDDLFLLKKSLYIKLERNGNIYEYKYHKSN